MVPRSQGGKDGPLRELCWNHHEMCRLGTLHFRYDVDVSGFLITPRPIRYATALELDGWEPLP